MLLLFFYTLVMMRLLLYSHDSAAFMHKTAWRLFHSPLSVLTRRYASQNQPFLNFRILNLSIPGLPVSSATLVSPLDASSCNAYIGGGCSRIAWATIQSFIVSRPSGSPAWAG